MRAVHPHPHNIGRPPTAKADALGKNPGAFRASRRQIVRPFEAYVNRAEISCDARERYAGDKAELSRSRGRTGVDHKRAGVKIALGRDPRAAPATSSRGLLVSDDP